MIRIWLYGAIAASMLTCIVFGVSYMYHAGYVKGSAEIQTLWDAEKAQAALKAQELQTNMDKLREDKNRETARLSATVRALTNSLRDRAERPAIAASGARSDSEGCTGAELYKPDGTFLVGEAARADAIRLALIQCQQAYQAASQ